MTLAAGTKLGPYEILAPLGAGGMGEAYRAKDARLGRDVAVKILPQQLSSPEARRRFEREAKTISALSHPHICALYDVGREGETEYLVMELLEGETLSARLAKTPLPLEQALRFGIDIALALDAAHRRGIIHREMATGLKAFSGASRASLITAILSKDPPSISGVRPIAPPVLDRLVTTCLAKDPDERWQSAADVARELKWIAAAPASEPGSRAGAGRRNLRERLTWGIAAAALLLGASTAFLSRRPIAPEELTRFTIMPPSGQGFLGFAELSPDARRLLFLIQDEGGRPSIAVRSLHRLEMRRLAGTEDARGMFWSPDGREIAFFSEGKLRRIGVDGGPVQTICESGAGFSGAWSRQGTILFTKEFGDPIVRVSAAGGTPEPVTALDPARGDVAHFHPAFLPDARHFVFVARNLDPEKTSIMLGSLDSKDARQLLGADSSAVFADPGYLLFARGNALFAWRFDPPGTWMSESWTSPAGRAPGSPPSGRTSSTPRGPRTANG